MDRIMVQVRFKKFLWTCHKCAQEDVVEASMNGGNEYVHTCSACSAVFNQSGSNLRQYDGCYTTPQEDYTKLDETAVEKAKSDQFNAWLDGVKNPPAYVEPSKEDYQNLYNEKMAEATQYLDKYAEKATVEELEVVKDSLTSSITNLQTTISEKPISEEKIG